MKKQVFLSLLIVTAIAAASFKNRAVVLTNPVNHSDTILFEGEKHFTNVQQLTFGGDNAEAYFSFDGKWIIFQRTNPKEGIMCDEMFIGKVPGPGEKFEYKKVSQKLVRIIFSY